MSNEAANLSARPGSSATSIWRFRGQPYRATSSRVQGEPKRTVREPLSSTRCGTPPRIWSSRTSASHCGASVRSRCPGCRPPCDRTRGHRGLGPGANPRALSAGGVVPLRDLHRANAGSERREGGQLRRRLDPRRHLVAAAVTPGVTGSPTTFWVGGACPAVRLTAKLRSAMKSGLDEEAQVLMESYDPAILARAVNYLYTKETRSSFALEGETPSGGRAERFVAALKSAPPSTQRTRRTFCACTQPSSIPGTPRTTGAPSRTSSVRPSADTGSRCTSYVRARRTSPASCGGWTALTRRVTGGGVDPVVAAAVSSVRLCLRPSLRGRQRADSPLPHAPCAHQARIRPARNHPSGLRGDPARPARLRRCPLRLLAASAGPDTMGMVGCRR